MPLPRHPPVLAVLPPLFGVYSVCLLGHYLARASGLFADSYGLWSFARFVSTHPPAAIYDQQALLAFQVALGLSPTASFPFGYPPPFLLLLAPLAWLPYWLAATCWSLLTLLLCLAAVLAGRRPGMLATLLLLLAPSTAIGLMYGQTGFLFAAVLIGGMRLAERHPWLGGAVLGLMACKPQLAVLVPVALLAAGRGRALAAMLLSSAGLMALAAAVYSPALCLAWPGGLISYAAVFRAGSGPRLLHLMPTITAAGTLLGLPNRAASALQCTGAVLGVILTWRSHRRRQPGALLTLAAATFLASPYAFVYDLPLLTAAALACLIDRLPSLPPGECALLATVLCVPMLVLAGPPVGLVAIAAGLLLARPGFLPRGHHRLTWRLHYFSTVP